MVPCIHEVQPPFIPFTGLALTFFTCFEDIAICMSYFNAVWGIGLLHCLVCKTNKYTKDVPQSKNDTRCRSYWAPLTFQQLRLYFGVCLLMGIKNNPNSRSYWATSTFFFHCPVINLKIIRTRFELITRCLHVANFVVFE